MRTIYLKDEVSNKSMLQGMWREIKICLVLMAIAGVLAWLLILTTLSDKHYCPKIADLKLRQETNCPIKLAQ